MIVDKATGYSYYASYFINGDASGLSDEEQVDANAFAEYCGGLIVGCAEESHFGTPDNGGLAGDIIEYTIHRHE